MQVQYPLENQAFDYVKLLEQLRDPTDVVMAWYTVGGKGQSTIVTMRDEMKLQQYRNAGKSKALDQIRLEADSDVIFTAGPENAKR